MRRRDDSRNFEAGAWNHHAGSARTVDGGGGAAGSPRWMTRSASAIPAPDLCLSRSAGRQDHVAERPFDCAPRLRSRRRLAADALVYMSRDGAPVSAEFDAEREFNSYIPVDACTALTTF